jgi:hypothetical protein
MNSEIIIEKLNIEKLQIIKEFYYFINENNKDIKDKSNIFSILNFVNYKQNIYHLLENNKNLYMSFNDDNLYNIDIIYKKEIKNEYKMTQENKNFIDNMVIKFLNEVIDHIYDRQNINYYLDLFKL